MKKQQTTRIMICCNERFKLSLLFCFKDYPLVDVCQTSETDLPQEFFISSSSMAAASPTISLHVLPVPALDAISSLQ